MSVEGREAEDAPLPKESAAALANDCILRLFLLEHAIGRHMAACPYHSVPPKVGTPIPSAPVPRKNNKKR
jgi:hypothetical protein